MLHLAISLLPKVAVDHAPLVVALSRILPIDPRVGLYVTLVVEQGLCQPQVAIDAASASTHLAHPEHLASASCHLVHDFARFVVGLVGVYVPLPHQIEHSCLLVGLDALGRGGHLCLIGGRYDCLQSRGFQDGGEHPQESNLRFEIEMATLLAAVAVPIVGHGFVERVERLKLDAIHIFIVFANVNQIVGKLLVILRSKIVLVGIVVATHTTAIRHVIGATVGECLKDGIGTFLLNLQHNTTLR